MPTRLNAILLIPVMVGLVMGGFQVKSSIDTWQEAQDAESTARLVRASLTYANALNNERDITAAPLLQGQGRDRQDKPTVDAARKATDNAADAFDEAAQNMPEKAGLLAPPQAVPQGRAAAGQPLRAAAYTSKLTGCRPKRATSPSRTR